MFFRPGPWLLQGLAQVQQALPSQCGICGRWPSQRVCGDCTARWAGTQPRCRRCALPLPAGAAECGACLRAPPAFDAAWAAVDYGYPWSLLLAQLKFQQDPGAAYALAQLLARVPGVSAALASARWIVPVPLSDQRLRERGFNQAALLARALAGNCAPLPQAPDCAHLLVRARHTPAQSGLQRDRRLRNLRGAFEVPAWQTARLAGQRVVLVDDIMTTGATLDAAAQALRRAGASHICAMVVARTQRLPRQ
ncbi:ComF family protein [Pantoea sp. 18069]|uniref:ComF family protein n=1 Tax=Pantoea sp. 18069 TaxID=2681415 RepID=UPI001358BF21|nr:ComF family protein [Pantoea sp. 18069]